MQVTAVFELPIARDAARRSWNSNSSSSSGSDGTSDGGGVSNSTSGAPGFGGPGFYVQPGAHVSSRLPIRLAAGDLIAHSFDLQHGVEVSSGRRCSVIFWFTDSAASCKSVQPRTFSNDSNDSNHGRGCRCSQIRC